MFSCKYNCRTTFTKSSNKYRHEKKNCSFLKEEQDRIKMINKLKIQNEELKSENDKLKHKIDKLEHANKKLLDNYSNIQNEYNNMQNEYIMELKKQQTDSDQEKHKQKKSKSKKIYIDALKYFKKNLIPPEL